MNDTTPRKTACPAGSIQYIWREGDSVLAAAVRTGVSEGQVRAALGSVPAEEMRPGYVLCIARSAASCSSGRLYAVREGDSIVSIAAMHEVTPLRLMEANPYVDPEALTEGELICLPEPGSLPPFVQPAGAAQCPEGYTAGIVGYGQTFADLLIRYNIAYRAFQLANPTLSLDSLLPGQRFCVPPESQRGLSRGCGQSYTMRQGETLESLAERLGMEVGRLLWLNPNLAPSDFAAGFEICLNE